MTDRTTDHQTLQNIGVGGCDESTGHDVGGKQNSEQQKRSVL